MKFTSDLFAEGMLGEDKELQQEFQQLVKGEIELFKAIVKGKGVGKSICKQRITRSIIRRTAF